MLTKGRGVSGKSATMRIVTKIMNEAMEDMRDANMHPEIMALYIKQLSGMTYWVATGKWDSEIPIPEDFEV